MPKGIPLTEDEIGRRRYAILRAAVGLIVKQGFTETSMQEIARASGVGKSTLYDYFPTKEAILILFFEEELEIIQKEAETIVAQAISAKEKLSKILESQLLSLIDNKYFFIELSLQAQRLSQASQKQIMQRRYVYQDLLRGVIEQGVREGVFRPVNTRLAARTLLSMIEVLVYTTRPTGSPQEMLADAMDIFMRGIQNEDYVSNAIDLGNYPHD
jgi:AcrR family transcriptional regulator